MLVRGVAAAAAVATVLGLMVPSLLELRGPQFLVFYVIDAYAEVPERAANDPMVRGLAETGRTFYDGSAAEPASACAAEPVLADGEPLEPYARSFDSLLVVSTRGCTRARFPAVWPDTDYHKNFFGWRDYFRGAERYGRRGETSTYVAHAFRSKLSQKIRFAPSTPIVRGTVEASGRGREPFERSGAAPLTIDGYKDPLLGGSWLAAFAPVGGTGYVVLVQTRSTVAIRPSDVLTRRLAGGLGLALIVVLVAFGALALARARRAKRRDGP